MQALCGRLCWEVHYEESLVGRRWLFVPWLQVAVCTLHFQLIAIKVLALQIGNGLVDIAVAAFDGDERKVGLDVAVLDLLVNAGKQLHNIGFCAAGRDVADEDSRLVGKIFI